MVPLIFTKFGDFNKGVEMVKTSIENLNTFHSEFTVSKTAGENHVLRLRLGIHFEKMTGITSFSNSLNPTPFKIREWTDLEWYAFRNTVFTQSDMWNNQFWLIPPKDFTELDINAGYVKFRPNVKCELFVQVWNTPALAQKRIKLAKLDDTVTGDSTAFRSDALTYDSLDGVPHVFPIPDAAGNMTNITHYTIPHEIGHALGQPHIGVLKKVAACTLAIAGNPADNMSAGGANSHRCYGFGGPPSIAENIMGYGTKFDEVNAEPWVTRVAEHTATDSKKWTVKMAEMPPFMVT